MKYIFIDESGDLGFSKASSKWFLFVISATEEQEVLARILKKIWRNLDMKYKKSGELHAYHTTDSVRIKVLRAIGTQLGIRIVYYTIEKQHIPPDLRQNKELLYNRILTLSIKDLYTNKILLKDEYTKFYIDQMYTKKQMNEKLEYEIRKILEQETGTSSFSITFSSSHKNKSLQAVDFISWAIFQKFERFEEKYYRIIQEKLESCIKIDL